jgi:hypothetical protein
MKIRNVLTAAALASVLTFSAGLAKAQVLYGTLTGNITDLSGATVPNAKVEAVNTGTGQVKQTTADDHGEYAINDVQAGTYKGTISAKSFGNVVEQNVVVDANTVMPQGFFGTGTELASGVHRNSRQIHFPLPVVRDPPVSRGGRCGQDSGTGEAMPDTGVEVRTFGFGPQQFLKRLRGNIEVMVNGAVAGLQFRKGQLVLVSGGLQQGGVERDPLHRYPLRFGKVCGLPHTVRGQEGRLRVRLGSLAWPA